MNSETVVYKKGSFLRRTVAFLIDSGLLLIILIPLNIFLIHLRLNIFFPVQFIITAAYNTFFVSRTGATIGKRLLKLKVVNKNYEQPKLIHVLIRETIGKYISGLILGIGFLWVLNDKKRQALHDKFASTYVVKENHDGSLIPQSEEEKVSVVERLIFLVIVIPIVLLVGLGVFYGVIARPYKVTSNAMEPNFRTGEQVAVTNAFSVKRGDVIIYSATIFKIRREYIKRAIGGPGETIMIKNSEVYINGKKLDESHYLSTGTKTPPGPFIKDGVAHKIPKGYYFVLSDNRSIGLDSRLIGFIPRKSITGKAWFCLLNCK